MPDRQPVASDYDHLLDDRPDHRDGKPPRSPVPLCRCPDPTLQPVRTGAAGRTVWAVVHVDGCPRSHTDA